MGDQRQRNKQKRHSLIKIPYPSSLTCRATEEIIFFDQLLIKFI